MKEEAILFGNRPLAATDAMDLKMEHHGDLIDEDIALKLGFVVRDLQYVRISLATNKKTRVTGRIRATLQAIEQGRPGHSLALNARVVRDLFSLTGSEVIAGSDFFKKLKSFKKKEKDRDTSNSLITGSSIAAPNIKVDACVPNVKVTKPVNIPQELERHSDEEPPWYLRPDPKLQAILNHCGGQGLSGTDSKLLGIKDLHCDEDDSSIDEHEDSFSGSSEDCSSCMVYSSCSSEEDDNPHNHRMRCNPHGEAHILRVRGRNKKLLDAARSKVTEEAVEAESSRRVKFQQKPDDFLDENFLGGAKFAHHLSERWAKEKKEQAKLQKKDKDKKLKKDKLDEKILKLKYGLTEEDFQIRKVSRKFKSDSD